ncbi:MepB family protein [Rhodococcus qingshengii]
MWRRSVAGPIRPFDATDRVMLFVVKAHDEEHLGRFIFPIETFVEHDIVSTNFSAGERAIRAEDGSIPAESGRSPACGITPSPIRSVANSVLCSCLGVRISRSHRFAKRHMGIGHVVQHYKSSHRG